jgi:hypothetical protein
MRHIKYSFKLLIVSILKVAGFAISEVLQVKIVGLITDYKELDDDRG